MKVKLLFVSLLSMTLLTGCIMYNGQNPSEESTSEESTSTETSESTSTISTSEASTSTSEVPSTSTSIPTSTSVEPGTSNTVYLVLTSVGQYKGASGTTFPEFNLENAIKYTAEVGSALPTKTDITVSSGSGVFSTWVSYEGEGKPTEYSVVPLEANKILYAKFINGGGTPEPEPEPGDLVTYYFTNNYGWTNPYVYLWYSGSDPVVENNPWPGDALLNPIKNSFNEDVYTISFTYGLYTHCIVSGYDTMMATNVQSLDIEFACFGSANNFYITGWEGEKATVGMTTFVPASAA